MRKVVANTTPLIHIDMLRDCHTAVSFAARKEKRLKSSPSTSFS